MFTKSRRKFSLAKSEADRSAMSRYFTRRLRTGARWETWTLAATLLMLIGFWFLWRQRQRTVLEFEPAPKWPEWPPAIPQTEPALERQTPANKYQTQSGEDLTLLDGIGPKISNVLHEAGIHTFQALAGMDQQEIETILRSAGIRLANTGTWSGQARLAAAGDWDGLKDFQNQTKRIRRG